MFTRIHPFLYRSVSEFRHSHLNSVGQVDELLRSPTAASGADVDRRTPTNWSSIQAAAAAAAAAATSIDGDRSAAVSRILGAFAPKNLR